MANPKIGIIVGSVREGRFAEKALAWLTKQTEQRDDLDFEVLDLIDYPMPFYNEPQSPSSGAEAQNEVARRWRQKVKEMDGFVFVTAEYNHGPTAVLKNALDWCWYEWNGKPVAFMGYGNSGASRAIEHLRDIIVELEMMSVRPVISVGGRDMFEIWDGKLKIEDIDHLPASAEKTLDALSHWAYLTRQGRAKN